MRVTRRSILNLIKWIGITVAICLSAVVLSLFLLVSRFFSQESRSKYSPVNQNKDSEIIAIHLNSNKLQKVELSVSHGVTKANIGPTHGPNDLTITQPASEQKSPTTLNELIYLMSEPVTKIELCTLDCQELDRALARYQAYFKGHFSIDDEALHSDPAFHLACAMNQAALGPAGKELFNLFSKIQQNPYRLRSFDLVRFVFHMDDIAREFDERGLTKAREAEDLVSRLQNAAKSCEGASWKAECRDIEADISNWIEDGALQ